MLLKGNNDLLSITRPDVIREIHLSILAAGADIILKQIHLIDINLNAGFKMSNLAGEINRAAVKLAREAADEFTKLTPEKPRFVAGSIWTY